MNKIRIEKIWITWEPDVYPDLSWLATSVEYYTEDGCSVEDAEKYAQQDSDRLNRYGLQWEMLSCVAHAEVSYPLDAQGNRRLERLRSGGLYGIESDSESSYKDSVEADELVYLKAHLEMFNVDLSNFDAARVELAPGRMWPFTDKNI